MTRLLMTADAVGGVWQYAAELATALVPFGIETVIALLGPEPAPVIAADAPYRVVHTGLPLDWLADGPEPVLAAGRAVAALAHAVQADVVQLNAPILAACEAFDRPVVAVDHGCLGTWWHAIRGDAPLGAFDWNVALTAAGLRAADAVVAPSAAFAAAVQRCYDLPSTPIVVHNGRTPPAQPPGEAQANHVFTAGRLWDEAKNAGLLDAVAARIDVPLRAAGALAGPHGERFAPARIMALGHVDGDAIAGELATRPIYLSAARFEPFGLSVLEAASAGCALVLSGIDTFRELWTGSALLVPDDDADAYAAAIARLRTDPALRAHLGEAARLRAARYTPAGMATAMAAILAGIATPAAQVAA